MADNKIQKPPPPLPPVVDRTGSPPATGIVPSGPAVFPPARGVDSGAAAARLRRVTGDTRAPLTGGIYGGRHPVGNTGAIEVAGVRDTPNGIVGRVLEHEPPLPLLDEAFLP